MLRRTLERERSADCVGDQILNEANRPMTEVAASAGLLLQPEGVSLKTEFLVCKC